MRTLLLIAIVLGVLIFAWPGWDNLLIRPMVNIMAIFYLISGNFGVAIIILTVITRLLLVPLTLMQNKQTAKMRVIQPQMRALQKKYSGQKDPEARRKYQQEIAAVYRSAGVSPIGCLGPIIVQFPIWIALYQTILRAIPSSPDGLVNLFNSMYSWNPANSVLPINPYLFGIDLGASVSNAMTPWQFMIPVLVGATLWLQQRVAAPPSVDPQQQSSQRILQWLLPIMFGYFTWFFPTGLAFYILVSNVFGVLLQFVITRKSPMALIFGEKRKPQDGEPTPDYKYKAVTDTPPPPVEEKEAKPAPVTPTRARRTRNSRKTKT